MPFTRQHFCLDGKTVFVAGHLGMVGRALLRRLAALKCRILTADRAALDLTDQPAVFAWFAAQRPQAVLIAAAKVGGIMENALRPAEFIYTNLAIELNVIEAARRAGVGKLMFFGSSCMYPKFAEQPLREEMLMTGVMEPTSEAYSLAKLAGLKMCQAYRRQYGCDFITIIPNTLYGPYDSFDPAKSHVLPALIVKAHEAKINGAESLPLWGSGTVLREFMYVDDMADAALFLMERYSEDAPINVGSGDEVSIAQLAAIVAETVGWRGRFIADISKPDGAPRKLLDTSRLAALGWQAPTRLREGVARTYQWYLDSIATD